MNTQTLDAQVVMQSKHLPTRHGSSKRGKAVITLVLSGAPFVGMGAIAWGMLRAGFVETFRMISISSAPIADACA